MLNYAASFCLKASVQVKMNLRKFIIFCLTSAVLYTDTDAEIKGQRVRRRPKFWSGVVFLIKNLIGQLENPNLSWRKAHEYAQSLDSKLI